MLKQLLTGSALALLMAATPVAAQSDNATEQQPQAEAAQPSTETPAASDSATGSTMESTDTAQDSSTTTDSATTAQSGESMTSEPATAQDDSMKNTDEMATGEATTDAAPMDQASGEMYIGQQAQEEVLASDLIGTTVENSEGENLGDINDVIVSEVDGLKAVVIGVGGFLGIGEKNVAVSYDQVEQSRDENGDLTLVLNTTKDDLQNAPKFVSLEEQEEAQNQQAEAQQNDSMSGSGSMTGSGATNNNMGSGTTTDTMGTTGTGTTEGQSQ